MRLNTPDTDFDAKTRQDLLPASQRARIFKLMLERGEPKEWADWLRAPLEHACESGDSELVDALLAAGADGSPRGPGRRGRTLLHAAAAGGNESVIWSLLDHGAKPDLEAKLIKEEWLNPYTPLQVAVAHGHAAAAKVLVAAGADTARTLVVALGHGHHRLAYDLLVAGADPDEPGFDGWVLTRACRGGHERLVRALLQKGADVAAPTMGFTPLHEAARGGHAAIAEVLLGAGLDVHAFTWQGETPLHAAAVSGSAATVDVLIAAGADPGARHPTLGQGRSPLHLAAEEGHAEAALTLLQQQQQRGAADVNAADSSGLRPLHLACKGNRAELVDLLLRWGADETAEDRDGNAPVDLLPTPERIAQDVARYATDGTVVQEKRRHRDECRRHECDSRDRAIRLLTRAPADRAWRRRGVAVLCRARAEALRLRAAAAAGPAMPPSGCNASGNGGRKLARCGEREGAGGVRRRAASGEGAPGDDGVGARGLGAWLVDLQEEGVFRNIVGFL